MSTFLVHYAMASQRSAAGFGAEWDAERRGATQRAKTALRSSGRIWAKVREAVVTTPAPPAYSLIAF